MSKRLINPQEFLEDLKEGTSDTELMKKYDIPFQSILEDLFDKLVVNKLATQDEIDNRYKTLSLIPIEGSLNQVHGVAQESSKAICPKCGYQRTANDNKVIPFTTCPSCSIIYEKYRLWNSGSI